MDVYGLAANSRSWYHAGMDEYAVGLSRPLNCTPAMIGRLQEVAHQNQMALEELSARLAVGELPIDCRYDQLPIDCAKERMSR